MTGTAGRFAGGMTAIAAAFVAVAGIGIAGVRGSLDAGAATAGIAIAAIVGLALSAGVRLVVSRTMVRPLPGMRELLGRAATGDLTGAANEGWPGDWGTVASEYNKVMSAREAHTAAASAEQVSASVHTLATGTDQIAAAVTGVATSSASTSSGIRDSEQETSHLSSLAAALADLVGTFSFATAHSASLDVGAQITKAIGAHGKWKARLLDAIESGSHSEDVTKVALDNVCEFGQWLHSADVSPAYAQFRDQARAEHAQFHKEAAAVLTLIGAGKITEARFAIDMDGSFAAISRELTATMTAWRKRTQAALV